MKKSDSTFAKHEHLPLFEGMVNSSVLVEDELRLSAQCMKMYKRLLTGPATNIELQKLTNSQNPTARRSDLRAELKKHGWNLKKIVTHSDGVNSYAITNAEGNIVQ